MTEEKKSTLFLFFDGMPGWARSIIFAMLTFPVALAISGMLLNVNVGANIDRLMDLQFQKQINATEVAADRIIDAFDTRLKQLEAQIALDQDERLSLDRRVTSIETRLKVNEVQNKRLDALEFYVCDNDGLGPGDCRLKGVE